MIRILNAEPDRYCQRAFEILQSIGHVDAGALTRSELISRIADYDALIVRLGHQVDREVIEAGTRLKAIVTATTGLDHIDVDCCAGRGIEVLSLRGETDFLSTVTATAELTWALLLALARRVPEAFQSVKEGQWDRDKFRGNELQGKTLGIVGLGRLGSIVAEFGTAFRMRVIAFDPYKSSAPENITLTSTLEDLLSSADVISLHIPLNKRTVNFISANQLDAIKPGAILLNTSRGPIVDQESLLEALRSGRLAGAGLDVVQDEPSFPGGDSRALLTYAQENHNLIVTPHIGGATRESMEKTEVFMAEKLKAFLGRNGNRK